MLARELQGAAAIMRTPLAASAISFSLILSACPAAADAVPQARVHIETPGLTLFRKAAGADWEKACTAPCDELLPLGDTYRVSSLPTKTFRLDAEPGGAVELSVDHRSTGGIVAGAVVGGVGVLGMMVGSLFAVVGWAQNRNECGQNLTDGECRAWKEDAAEMRDGGLIALGISSVVVLGGALVTFVSAMKDVSQQPVIAVPVGRPLDAFVRRPNWRASSEGTITGPSFPVLLQGTF